MQHDPILAPNQGPFPSSINNNPEFQPLLQVGGERLNLGQVDGETTLGSPIGDIRYADIGPRDSLMALRMQFPHLEIIPFPTRCKSLALTANVAVDVSIPDGCAAMIVRGNNDYYMSNLGNADVPGAQVQTGTQQESQSVYKPEGYIIYCANIRQLSIIAPNAGTIVTFMFFPLVPMHPR